MIRFDVLTLFPELFGDFLSSSLVERARNRGHVGVFLHNLRRWSESDRGMIDDRPFGGGDGVILAPEPLGRALESVRRENDPRPVVYLTPQGRRFDSAYAQSLVERDGAVLLCGRYGGIDERIVELFVDEEVSIGDYVLMGGELPAMVVMEASCRFIPEVLGNEDSHAQDSFADGLLEAPQYTRPRVYRGLSVPEVLLSGDHRAIGVWRREKALERTSRRRPDLMGDDVAQSENNLLSRSHRGER